MKSKVICIILLSLSVFIAAQVPTTYAPTNLISINVTGFVDSPGTYQLSSISRLSEALKLAGTLSIILEKDLPIYRALCSEEKSVSLKILFLNYSSSKGVN
jgi:protein involved in polysaccharide export with SLBB domain